jgi:hypothetical protein
MQFSLFPLYSPLLSSRFTNSMLYASTYALMYSIGNFLLEPKKSNENVSLRNNFAIRCLYSFPIAYLTTLIASNSKEVLCMCYGALVLEYSNFFEKRFLRSISINIYEESSEDANADTNTYANTDANTDTNPNGDTDADANLKKSS